MSNSDIKIVYYDNELTDEFSTAEIKTKTVDKNFKYNGTILRPVGRALIYHALVKPSCYLYLKFCWGHKIIGNEVIKEYSKKNYFLFGNHTNDICDAFIPSMLNFSKGTYVVVHANNVSIPLLGMVTPIQGAIPLPTDSSGMRNFTTHVKKMCLKSKTITIYPEAHIWPYCTKIRNFTKDSFSYPVMSGAPSFCFVNTYHEWPGHKNPRIITYVKGPFFPDSSLPVNKQKQNLRDQIYETMVELSKNNTLTLVEYLPKDTKEN